MKYAEITHWQRGNWIAGLLSPEPFDIQKDWRSSRQSYPWIAGPGLLRRWAEWRGQSSIECECSLKSVSDQVYERSNMLNYGVIHLLLYSTFRYNDPHDILGNRRHYSSLTQSHFLDQYSSVRCWIHTWSTNSRPGFSSSCVSVLTMCLSISPSFWAISWLDSRWLVSGLRLAIVAMLKDQEQKGIQDYDWDKNMLDKAIETGK